MKGMICQDSAWSQGRFRLAVLVLAVLVLAVLTQLTLHAQLIVKAGRRSALTGTVIAPALSSFAIGSVAPPRATASWPSWAATISTPLKGRRNAFALAASLILGSSPGPRAWPSQPPTTTRSGLNRFTRLAMPAPR